MRVATYNTELERKGPGLLLRDIAKGDDPQVKAVIEVIKAADADILVLQNIDYDLTGAALEQLVRRLDDYPYSFARLPNTGMGTGLDMDGDGRLGGPRDAQGYGRFSGQGGMAILSRYPIVEAKVQDFSELLWTDIPGALLPEVDGAPFPSAEAVAAQRLSSTAHWVVPIETPLGVVHLLTFHATPPVFDGPEDRNGRRNHDEIIFWQQYLDGAYGDAPTDRFIVIGDANLDPLDGDGLKPAIRSLLRDPRLQDPSPTGAAGTDTADWSDPSPGNLRVGYILPSADWKVVDRSVMWPWPDDAFWEVVQEASRHRLVWVDLNKG
ncbi:endonuclease/exonuclease/phosphatase family protein [Ascidiaceihabitans sp.]|uniref:endonuclease/exonuclease/phosphatase family protein n=1 Tax=Ascidiaceihabitans sp. TaxID=1872644 RepID=UPI003296DA99